MLTIGLMSGTSMDAVDVAVVEFSPEQCDLISYHQFPIPDLLQSELKAVTPGTSISLLMRLDADLGDLFAACVTETMKTHGLNAAKVGVIGSHGQTLLHVPNSPSRNSLQIGDPNRIAWATKIRTVADFRRMDMAAGGQGAPLAPAFHAWRFRSPRLRRVIINIGGIANISILPPQGKSVVSGFDTGPGNALLDQWIMRHQGKPWDAGGTWAATGTPNPELLAALESESYFSQAPPKSTGRDLFNLEWLEQQGRAFIRKLAPADVQATLLEFTACTIANAIKTHAPHCDEAYVCGGGAHNKRLMVRLNDLLAPAKVASTDILGIQPNAVEAIMMAWLAWYRVEGMGANLPSVTGASAEVILGAVYEPRGKS